MMQKNPTFRGAEPTWANACVGNNGQPGYIDYSLGFSKAANILIDQVLKDHSIHLSVDEFVYPVCFNMRHSVELRLKGAIEEVVEIAKIKNINLQFNASGSHDIYLIWNYFKVHSESIDERYKEINKKIEPIILDIAQIDPTGQTFRYPVSTTSQKHLTDVSLINFRILKLQFNELEKNLDDLHKLNNWLNIEYKQGTFTSKLNRSQIFKIAKQLPRMEKWREPEFTEIKRRLQLQYSLSGKDFSRVVDVIKCHYNLAPLVGDPLPIKGLNEAQLLNFIDEWISENPNVKKAYNYGDYAEIEVENSDLLARILTRREGRSRVWDVLIDDISASYVAGIESLFYFARDKEFVEYYNTIYEIHTREANIQIKRNADLKDELMHIFNKQNAADNILMSLFALGHVKLAEAIIAKYDLEHSFRWLKDARSGRLFLYPDYAQY
ncbi:hypothetical protein [Pseudomonas sp. NPDC089569]|uniref:hypothetical protein n=1 Tax=Pseudomonas sp. NPDC089569 TaxID=3390722 RepID=UPI003D04D48D